MAGPNEDEPAKRQTQSLLFLEESEQLQPHILVAQKLPQPASLLAAGILPPLAPLDRASVLVLGDNLEHATRALHRRNVPQVVLAALPTHLPRVQLVLVGKEIGLGLGQQALLQLDAVDNLLLDCGVHFVGRLVVLLDLGDELVVGESLIFDPGFDVFHLGFELLDFVLQVLDIKDSFLLLVSESFLFLVHGLEGLVALPPPALEQLPLPLLLPTPVPDHLLDVLVTRLPLEEGQLLLQQLGLLRQLHDQLLLPLMEVAANHRLVFLGDIAYSRELLLLFLKLHLLSFYSIIYNQSSLNNRYPSLNPCFMIRAIQISNGFLLRLGLTHSEGLLPAERALPEHSCEGLSGSDEGEPPRQVGQLLPGLLVED